MTALKDLTRKAARHWVVNLVLRIATKSGVRSVRRLSTYSHKICPPCLFVLTGKRYVTPTSVNACDLVVRNCLCALLQGPGCRRGGTARRGVTGGQRQCLSLMTRLSTFATVHDYQAKSMQSRVSTMCASRNEEKMQCQYL